MAKSDFKGNSKTKQEKERLVESHFKGNSKTKQERERMVESNFKDNRKTKQESEKIGEIDSKGNSKTKQERQPYKCWQYFKSMYEVNNNFFKVHLMEKFFKTKNTSSMSINEYLMEIIGTSNCLHEVNVLLSKAIML